MVVVVLPLELYQCVDLLIAGPTKGYVLKIIIAYSHNAVYHYGIVQIELNSRSILSAWRS